MVVGRKRFRAKTTQQLAKLASQFKAAGKNGWSSQRAITFSGGRPRSNELQVWGDAPNVACWLTAAQGLSDPAKFLR